MLDHDDTQSGATEPRSKRLPAPPLPDSIPLEYFVRAMERIDENTYAPHGKNHTYEVVYLGKGYPPLAVLSFAIEELEGVVIPTGSYKGDANGREFKLLMDVGLEIGRKQDFPAESVTQTSRDVDLHNRPKGTRVPYKETETVVRYQRNNEVKDWILANAKGVCELCRSNAPFKRIKDSSPYLEVHHVIALADDGPDTVENAVAICPNCHARCHRSSDRDLANKELYQLVTRLKRCP